MVLGACGCCQNRCQYWQFMLKMAVLAVLTEIKTVVKYIQVIDL
jgi:hypothetical protein